MSMNLSAELQAAVTDLGNAVAAANAQLSQIQVNVGTLVTDFQALEASGSPVTAAEVQQVQAVAASFATLASGLGTLATSVSAALPPVSAAP